MTLLENYLEEIQTNRLKAAAVSGTLALAIAEILYGASKINKYFLSKAARECKKESFSKGQKLECITKYKIVNLQKQIQHIQKNKNNCKKHKFPDMCITRLNNYIKTKENKIKTLKNKMR